MKNKFNFFKNIKDKIFDYKDSLKSEFPQSISISSIFSESSFLWIFTTIYTWFFFLNFDTAASYFTLSSVFYSPSETLSTVDSALLSVVYSEDYIS